MVVVRFLGASKGFATLPGVAEVKASEKTARNSEYHST